MPPQLQGQCAESHSLKPQDGCAVVLPGPAWWGSLRKEGFSLQSLEDARVPKPAAQRRAISRYRRGPPLRAGRSGRRAASTTQLRLLEAAGDALPDPARRMASTLLRSGAGDGVRCQSWQSCHQHVPGVEGGPQYEVALPCSVVSTSCCPASSSSSAVCCRVCWAKWRAADFSVGCRGETAGAYRAQCVLAPVLDFGA